MGIASNVQHAIWILPIIAGVAWLVMMLAMLGVWRARMDLGDGPYASQFDSRIAYISDIGAYGLHWLFVLGCFITAITYFTTVIMINYPTIAAKREYERRLIKVLAVVAIVGGLVSSIALIALSFTSIATQRDLHLAWLFLFILGMLFTGLVMAGLRSRKPRPEGYRQLYAEHRKLFIFSWLVIVLEIGLAVAMEVLTAFKGYFAAGVVEWVVAGLFAPYLWSLIAYLPPVKVYDAHPFDSPAEEIVVVAKGHGEPTIPMVYT